MDKNFLLNPLITSQKPNTHSSVGGVAEWLNAPVLKTDVGESLPWVRIPPPPPYNLKNSNKNNSLIIWPFVWPHKWPLNQRKKFPQFALNKGVGGKN